MTGFVRRRARWYNPAMPTQSLAGNPWVLELDGELDAPLHLTFRDGTVFEHGMVVGACAEHPDGVCATIGEDVVLIIRAERDGVRPVQMVTRRPGEPDLVESARLVRDQRAN